MTTGTLTQRLRPIRIGFLVNPRNKHSVQKAIHINSLLWGGTFNPLIPCYKRLPVNWGQHKRKSDNALNTIKGYIEGFDPDFFVNLCKYDIEQLKLDDDKVIPPEYILEGFDDDMAPNIGSGIFEILKQFSYDELRFVRKQEIKFLNPNISNSYKLFISAIYGDIGNIFYDSFLKNENIIKESINMKNYLEFLSQEYMFPRRLVEKYLKLRTRGPFLLYLDAGNTLDVIDFWNLRAAGWDVWPIAKQAEQANIAMDMARQIIENAHKSDRHYQSMYHRATAIGSRSVSEQSMKNFFNSLNIKELTDGSGPKFTYKHEYTRIWDESIGKGDREFISPAYSKEQNIGLPEGQNNISFKPISPDFELSYPSSNSPKFAIEVTSKVYGHADLSAEVIPHGGYHISDVISNHFADDWRISKVGPVYLSRYQNQLVSYALPIAEPVMKAWFKEKGWDVEISSSGKIAKQMISQLGGTLGIQHIKYEGLIELLKELENKGSFSEHDFKGRISKMMNSTEELMQIERDKYILRLLENNIFQLGVELKCPICTQRSWYSLDTLSNIVQCLSCPNEYKVQTIALADKKWAYKAVGTFGLPCQAYGAYSVLLTLKLLMMDSHKKRTLLLSFDAKKDSNQIEVDLCFIVENDSSAETTQELVFAECKTYNEFEKDDIKKMKWLAKEFPESALVFSTLRPELTATEKRMLKPLVNSGRRSRKFGKPYNPVIILTGKELFAFRGIPYCWENKGKKIVKMKKTNYSLRNFDDIADATHQIHLNMQPFHEWYDEQWGISKEIT